MLDQAKMVGFLVTTDYDRAKEFFVGKLGFEFVSLDQFALVVRVGGHNIRISKAEKFTPWHGTVLGWDVTGIEAVVDWLASRGIVTEKYPFVEDKQRGIWNAPGGAKVAWFKDPDGNVIGISQH
jgi:catechol 2,3-dioxygenase-like lactoylglutathione lyase family enzyme